MISSLLFANRKLITMIVICFSAIMYISYITWDNSRLEGKLEDAEFKIGHYKETIKHRDEQKKKLEEYIAAYRSNKQHQEALIADKDARISKLRQALPKANVSGLSREEAIDVLKDMLEEIDEFNQTLWEGI